MTIPGEAIYECRERLQALGLPADDLDESTVAREARLRAMSSLLRACRMYPGSWARRFVRDLDTRPYLLSAEQGRMVAILWAKYRRQLRQLPGSWPDWIRAPTIPAASISPFELVPR